MKKRLFFTRSQLRQGTLKGELLRFIALCSTDKEFDQACNRYILKKREEKKEKGKGEVPGIAVVIEDKLGLREWWEVCTGEDITNSFGNHFSEAEIELLPEDFSSV